MAQAVDHLARGREAYAQGSWREAHEALTEADADRGLGHEDLERLATAAYMLARNEECYALLERLHREQLESGGTVAATNAAFWLGMHLFSAGEAGRGAGWIGRAQRLAAGMEDDRVEHGYLLLPQVFQREGAGDLAGAAEVAGRAVEYGERFGDRELFALAAQTQGRLLMRLGRTEEGRRLLDEAMVCVTAGELSPIAGGIVYCGVILACQEAFDLARAREWTEALSRWCERQPEMIAFTGRCRVHRAEVLHHGGAWEAALEESRVAEERCAAAGNRRAAGQAAYVRAEVHRVRGEPAAAEEAYREAARWGREPQPGLALLRVSQGRIDAALAAILRALAESTERAARARLLPAAVEVLLVAGRTQEARDASEELEALAGGSSGGLLDALAAQASGSVELVDGHAARALPLLRRAVELWEDLEAPYEAGRARTLVALACRELGDEEAARFELDAARESLAGLGAREVAGLELLTAGGARDAGLTPRELEVLRLVAAGRTNKAIAAELVVSERTVHRHVSNLFGKLGVSSRAAATAYAYENGLL